ncbi:uncharacterized protein LOC129947187 [Eupeodes corollae]|uniref:uncharacterized protein LOC129947187 n=1 Tax=Eupeodes corollae TaxID=290404 RepID=UPI0024914AA5|nr:uncharacterized protein LOC129947187 [Eupeodes corollae]
MAPHFTILLGILTFIQSTFGGLLHGVSYSAVSSPSANYNYGRIASYSSPSIIATPSVAATYSSSRYTAYTLVPLTASVAAPVAVSRQPVGGLFRGAYVAPSLLKHSGFSNSLFRQGVSAYAAVPIAGYRAHFGGQPSLRNFGTSLTSLRNIHDDTVSVQGLYPPPTGWENYADSNILNDQRNYGTFDNENPISIW